MDIQFQTKVREVHVEEKAIALESDDGSIRKESYHALVATDGSKSTIRHLMVEQGLIHAREYPVDEPGVRRIAAEDRIRHATHFRQETAVSVIAEEAAPLERGIPEQEGPDVVVYKAVRHLDGRLAPHDER